MCMCIWHMMQYIAHNMRHMHIHTFMSRDNVRDSELNINSIMLCILMYMHALCTL